MKLSAVAALLWAGSALAHLPGISRSTWTRQGPQVEAHFVFSKADAPARLGPLIEGCETVGEQRRDVEADGVEVTLGLRCVNDGPTPLALDGLLEPLGQSHRHFARHDGVDSVIRTGAAAFVLAAAETPPWMAIGAGLLLLGIVAAVRVMRVRRGAKP